MQWTKDLKISILEEDELKIEKLINTLPTFNSVQEMQEASYMMKEAYTFLSKRKNEFAKKLLQLKKQKAFITTNAKQGSSFDQHH